MAGSAGMSAYEGDATFRNLIVRGNKGPGGAGISIEESSPTIVNSSIVGNVATYSGSAVHVGSASAPVFVNVTLHGNHSVEGIGAIHIDDGNRRMITLRNTIVWGNTNVLPSQQQIYYVSANLLLDHAIIQGGCPSGAGCIEVHDLDPIFVDASGPDGIVGTADDDLRLQPASHAIDAGWHTCALTGAGEAYCWGSNWGGELGNGSNDSSPTPVPVSGGHTFKSIDSGQWHTCGLTTNGEAYCWGQGQQGRLGNGDGNDRYVPEQVAGGLRFVSIASALNHSCGLTAEGTAYCWGRNSEYQLGRAGPSSATPVMVALPGERLVSIAAGENHTCALTVDGKAYCWGLGSSGQLGAGSGDVHEYPPHTSLPVPVLGNHTFIAISAGGDVSCGIVTDGSAYCWGDGRAGQLGTGSEETAKVWNEPVKVSDVEDFISISNGESHTCGLTRSGTAYCWGSRAKGRIGDTNTSGTAHSPTEVSFAGTFIAIRAFEGHTCAIATDSATYCWGDGSFGQLGNGGTDSKAEPTLVTSFTH